MPKHAGGVGDVEFAAHRCYRRVAKWRRHRRRRADPQWPHSARLIQRYSVFGHEGLPQKEGIIGI